MCLLAAAKRWRHPASRSLLAWADGLPRGRAGRRQGGRAGRPGTRRPGHELRRGQLGGRPPVRDDREDRRGHLRDRVQGHVPPDGPGRGDQEDQDPARGRGRPFDRAPRDLAAPGPPAPQRRPAPRRVQQPCQPAPGVRVPRHGPEDAPEEVGPHGGRHPPERLPPVLRWPRVLPRASHPAPRPEAAERAGLQAAGRLRLPRGRHEPGTAARARGLRPRSQLLRAAEGVHPRGGHPLVPSPRGPARAAVVRPVHGHLVFGLHRR
mmetsp:Transcript_78277/g.210112  ORF Transcript_78277/g.210112 Transcript_78277/m.210112 type:complete len:264 (-) Transcript_78277:681-1472(-)